MSNIQNLEIRLNTDDVRREIQRALDNHDRRLQQHMIRAAALKTTTNMIFFLTGIICGTVSLYLSQVLGG